MMKRKTMTKSIAALAVTVSLATAYQPVAAWADPTPGKHITQANKAATYISTNVGTLTGQSAGQLGQELDGYIGLNAVKYNGGDQSLTTTALDAMNQDFVQNSTKADTYCGQGTASPNIGGCAKVAISLMSAGQTPSTSTNLTTYLNVISNSHTFNQYATNQALAIIALARAGKPIPSELYQVALNWSTSNSSYFPDTDTCGLMLTALSYVNDSSSAKTTAIANLKARLAAQKVANAAGWGLTYDGSTPTVANINSTAWAAPGAFRTGDATLQATAVAAQSVFTSNQTSTGAITPGTSGWNDMMSTTQSVPPLLGLRSYDNAGSTSTAAVNVGTTTSTAASLSAKGADSTVNSTTKPIAVIGNVPSGTITAQLLGTAPLINGQNNFTYCEPGMSGTFNPLSGKVASGSVTSSVANFTTSPTVTSTGCYKWKLTLTAGSTTLTQTTEPFAVRTS
ncbi:hypothetical protein [Acidipropionibacterium jensenii]|uniref:hypothetical protein n=2 Tax=Acidipropionibacterium jensenii TaxID=1749 RepID=UPI00264743DF|nr:hypothetical protein [Acidipropionibacterium jensenii]MDN5995592.1 hypothetical protein [Acidipropionibacterium jensenii]MDN6425666.1 hypothetical protein [Acidipropionibacterium jensenii]MDN6479446.1 hypothetical protein [Acidipropionibacterium jensenii]MDN6657513.1 hypothetical protein [Acidipropionibacterium jensenii]MDN6760576.1 hypothetical protein [Acidipropionibacterium jensenii]